jgi:hypothetical protein
MILSRAQTFVGSWLLSMMVLAPVIAGVSVETAGAALIPALVNMAYYREGASIMRLLAPGAVICALAIIGVASR